MLFPFFSWGHYLGKRLIGGFVLFVKNNSHCWVISSPSQQQKLHIQFVLGAGFSGPQRGIISKLSRSVETHHVYF